MTASGQSLPALNELDCYEGENAFEATSVIKPAAADLINGVAPEAQASLESVFSTHELYRRPSRPADYETESQALALLVQALGDAPNTILQTLADTILDVFQVGSAGLSLLTKDGTGFAWPAIAGAWRAHFGHGMPRDSSPCGDVLASSAPLLLQHPERHYPCLLPAMPPIEECLLQPFFVKGKAVGTIWAIAHNDQRKFDAEDLRMLEVLSRFASAAYQATEFLNTARVQQQTAEQAVRQADKASLDLRESEERYRMLFESLDEGFCIIEKVDRGAAEPLDFLFVEANPAFAVQSGVSNVVGKTLRQLFGDEAEEWLLTYDTVCATGKPIRFEREFVSQQRVLELYAFRLSDKLPHRVGVNFQDITQRKQAENRLRQNCETFFSLIENAPFGIYVVDSRFCLQQVSSAAQKVFSDVRSLLGHDFEDVLRRVWAEPFVLEALRHVRHTLQTGESYAALNTIRRPQDIHQLESYDWKIERIMLPDGQFGVVCYFYDITERLRAEDALHESEAFSCSIFKSSPDCIKVLDLEGNLLSMQSGQELLGIEDISPFLNKSWLDFWSGQDKAPAQTAINAAAAGKATSFVGFFRTFLGEVTWWDVAVSPILGADGRAVRLLAVSRNVTEHHQAEQALRESQQFLRSTLNALSGHIAVLDESGTILEINKAWKWFARENQAPDGSIGVAVGVGVNYLEHCRQSMLDGGHTPAYVTGINEVISGKRARFEMEYPCHSPTEQRWFVMRVTRFQGLGPVRIVIVHDNCTERKLAQEASRESNERYRNLLDKMDEGFCIIEMIFDEHEKPVDFRYVEVNPAFEKHSRLRNVTGKRVREFVPDLEQHWLEFYGQVALTGEPARIVKHSEILDGWLDVYAARLGAPDKQQVAVIFSNVTERTVNDSALRHSEERFRALFDRGPIAMYTCDAAGLIQEFNRNAVALWGREPVRGDPSERFCGASPLYFPDGALIPESQSPIGAVLKGQAPVEHGVEAVIERPDGSRTTIIANIVPLKNARGDITGAINCMYDISERSRSERIMMEQSQMLEEQDRRKDEFLAMLSHELRNPLAPLSNAVQLLALRGNEDPVQLDARRIIERQLGQLKYLVDDLLEVSRITNGSIRLRMTHVSIDDIVERALETVQPLFEQRRHELSVSLPQEPVFLDADPARLEQVLVNLLGNAAKYTDAGGSIWLNIELESSAETALDGAAEIPAIVITVRDTGIGIAPELLPRIFDLFTQAQRSLDRSQGGLGIGLSLVQRLVELHGGTVKAYSTAGRGSEFVVRLPRLLTVPAPLPLPMPSFDETEQLEKSLRVLVVDDNVDSVNTLAKLLKMFGHEVEVAYDGPTGLAAALALRPDVVLLDIGLPGMTGFEVAEQIRQHPALESMMLIALTGYGQDTDRQLSQVAGFNHHLTKPADFTEVQRILSGVARRAA